MYDQSTVSEPLPPSDEPSSTHPAPQLSSNDVEAIQLALRDAGFDPGVIDGILGSKTADALRRFQARNGIPVDGIPGTQTRDLLAGVRVNESPPASPAPPTERTGPEAAGSRPAVVPDRPDPVVLLSADADRDVADWLEQTLSSGNLAHLRYAVDKIVELAPEELDGAGLIVPCLSSAFMALPWRNASVILRQLERAATGTAQVAPLLLEPVELSGTPFSSFQALHDGAPLSEATDGGEWMRSVATQMARLVGVVLPTSYLPRFSAESMEGEDLIGRRERIEFLASVFAAKKLETPLAVGLFGDWGSGKTFFMRRLQDRIVELTEASAHAVIDGRPSLYCSHVRHVTFNPWLYDDEQIWPALAAQIFLGVAGLETEAPAGSRQGKDLEDYQERLRAERRAVAEQEDREERVRVVEEQIDETRKKIAGLAPDVGGPAGQFVGTLREIGARLLGLRAGWRDLRVADLLLLVAIALAVLGYAVLGSLVTWVVAVLVAVLAVLRYLDDARRLRRQLKELEAELRDARQQQRVQEDQGRRFTESVAQQLPLLPEYAAQEASEWAHRADIRADVEIEIRKKFDRLSQLISRGVEARRSSGALPDDALPIERVIVYVDDLDRCQPHVVVRVLDTLKLLLSFPHFVVVVGVDSRWLMRALEIHFGGLLGPAGAEETSVASPHNYLDKIFQFSIALRPITSSGFGRLIEHLFAREELSSDTAGGTRTMADHGDASQERRTVSPYPIRDGQQRIPSGSDPVVAAEPDLSPAELIVTRRELEFMSRLAPLIETPRAAKRLANVYRFMRVSVGADRLIQPQAYEPVLLLLSISIGFPGLAAYVFHDIGLSPAASWDEFVHDFVPGTAASAVKLKLALERVSSAIQVEWAPSVFAQWIPVVAEFSFQPWQGDTAGDYA